LKHNIRQTRHSLDALVNWHHRGVIGGDPDTIELVKLSAKRGGQGLTAANELVGNVVLEEVQQRFLFRNDWELLSAL
jgi:hypothetical protein